jgi:hypothetical protein
VELSERVARIGTRCLIQTQDISTASPPDGPDNARGKEPSKAYRQHLRQRVDALYVNLGTLQADPHHRFTNLYSLMHWDYWLRCAADAVLARPGSTTAGMDGMTRFRFKEQYEEEITALRDSLKRKTYIPQPVRRVHIPKGAGKT